MEVTKNTKKEIPYISVDACPICGEHPQRIEVDLGKPGGRGYPGNSTYEYRCEFCKTLKGGETTDIYVSRDEAINLAKELWNDEARRVQNYIDRVYVPKALAGNHTL